MVEIQVVNSSVDNVPRIAAENEVAADPAVFISLHNNVAPVDF